MIDLKTVLAIDVRVVCPACDGTRRAGAGNTRCSSCAGTGVKRSTIAVEELIRLVANVPTAVRTNAPAEKIRRVVAQFFGVSLGDLDSAKRTKDLTLARHIAMWLVRQETRMSFPDIARVFGQKSHAGVIYGVRRIGERRKNSADVVATFLLDIEDVLSPLFER